MYICIIIPIQSIRNCICIHGAFALKCESGVIMEWFTVLKQSYFWLVALILATIPVTRSEVVCIVQHVEMFVCKEMTWQIPSIRSCHSFLNLWQFFAVLCSSRGTSNNDVVLRCSQKEIEMHHLHLWGFIAQTSWSFMVFLLCRGAFWY